MMPSTEYRAIAVKLTNRFNQSKPVKQMSTELKAFPPYFIENYLIRNRHRALINIFGATYLDEKSKHCPISSNQYQFKLSTIPVYRMCGSTANKCNHSKRMAMHSSSRICWRLEGAQIYLSALDLGAYEMKLDPQRNWIRVKVLWTSTKQIEVDQIRYFSNLTETQECTQNAWMGRLGVRFFVFG